MAHAWATARGAAVWRVHDVASAFKAARLVKAFARGANTI
jgi:dihydropteroate synthase